MIRYCEVCGYQQNQECLTKGRCMIGKDIVICEHCNEFFEWDKLTDEQVRTTKEYHGQPYLRPETVVMGWLCDCGHYNAF